MRRRGRNNYRGSFNPGMTSTISNVDLGHADKAEFRLKDYTKTADKYADYKNEKWDTMKNGFNVYLDGLEDDVYAKLKEKESYGALPGDLSKKSSLNQLKTWINSLTYQNNLEEMKRYADNPNEARAFTVRLYLDNYDTINAKMKNVYLRYVGEKA